MRARCTNCGRPIVKVAGRHWTHRIDAGGDADCHLTATPVPAGKERAALLDDLVRLGSSSAHDVVVGMVFTATSAVMTEAGVRAALDGLESNGLISFKGKLGDRYEYRVQARGGRTDLTTLARTD